MWIIPKNLDCFPCVLIMTGTKPMSVFGFRKQFKIVNMIVGSIAIFMVYIMAFGYFAVFVFPNNTMEILAITIGTTIITIGPACILFIFVNDIRQRLNFAERQTPTREALKYSLPTYSECFANFCATESFLIQIVHCFRNFNIGFAAHNYNLREWLANVN